MSVTGPYKSRAFSFIDCHHQAHQAMCIRQQFMPVRWLPPGLLFNITPQFSFWHCPDMLTGPFPFVFRNSQPFEIKPFKQRLYIQARPANQDGDFMSFIQAAGDLCRHVTKTGRRIGFVRSGNIDEMMTEPGQFICRRFGRTDIHSLIYLIGIPRNELCTVMICQVKTESRLTYRRRAGYCNNLIHEFSLLRLHNGCGYTGRP